MKRICEILGVSLALPAIFPLMAILSLLIKQDSSGPVFFRQDRVGLQGISFKVYKFRTMVKYAEQMGTSVTTSTDSRITPIGRILRKAKLDELPQLINVFKGDMSLVGPRPEVPEIVKNYSPEMRRIFRARPGITSVATVHLRDEEEILAKLPEPDRFYEEVLVPLKVKMALEHVDRNSIAFDLKILWQTVWMLTFGKWWPIKQHPEVTALKGIVN